MYDFWVEDEVQWSWPREERIQRTDGPQVVSFADQRGPEPKRRGSSRRDRARQRRVPDPELPSSPSKLQKSTTLRKDPGFSGQHCVTERRKRATDRRRSASIAKESGFERSSRGRMPRDPGTEPPSMSPRPLGQCGVLRPSGDPAVGPPDHKLGTARTRHRRVFTSRTGGCRLKAQCEEGATARSRAGATLVAGKAGRARRRVAAARS